MFVGLLWCAIWFAGVCHAYYPPSTKAKTTTAPTTTTTTTTTTQTSSTTTLPYCAQQCGPLVSGHVYRDCSGIPLEMVGRPAIGNPCVKNTDGCVYIDVACNVKDNGFPVQVQFNNELEVTKTEPPLNNMTVTLACTNDPTTGRPRWTKIGVDNHPDQVVYVEQVSCDRDCRVQTSTSQTITMSTVQTNPTTPTSDAPTTPLCIYGCVAWEFGSPGLNCDYSLLDRPWVLASHDEYNCPFEVVECAANSAAGDDNAAVYIKFNDNESTIVQAKNSPFNQVSTVLNCTKQYGLWTVNGVDGSPNEVVQVHRVSCGRKCSTFATSTAKTESASTKMPNKFPPDCAYGCAVWEVGSPGLNCDHSLLDPPVRIVPELNPLCPYYEYVSCAAYPADGHNAPFYIMFNDNESTIVQSKESPFNTVYAKLNCSFDQYGNKVWTVDGVDGSPNEVVQVHRVSCGRKCSTFATSTAKTESPSTKPPFCAGAGADGCVTVGLGNRYSDCTTGARLDYPKIYRSGGCYFVDITCLDCRTHWCEPSPDQPIYIEFNNNKSTIVTSKPYYNYINVVLKCAYTEYGKQVYVHVGVDGDPGQVVEVEKVSCARHCPTTTPTTPSAKTIPTVTATTTAPCQEGELP